MEMQGEYCAWTQQEWDELWARRAPSVRVTRDLLGPESEVPAMVREACSFLGGVALRSGFRLFRNGGLPLIERRRGAWTEEVLFRSPPSGRPGVWAPLTVQIHLSCEDFFEVRQRYWSVASRPPKRVAAGNIGHLDSPPRWLLWNLAGGSPVEPVVEAIAHRLVDQVIPWLDAFGNPARMRNRLYESGMPMLDPLTSLEWMLYEFGVGEATQFLHRVVLADDAFRDSVLRIYDRVDSAYLEGGPDVPTARSVAALAATFGLTV